MTEATGKKDDFQDEEPDLQMNGEGSWPDSIKIETKSPNYSDKSVK